MKIYVKASFDCGDMTKPYSVWIVDDNGEIFENNEFDSLEEAKQYAKEQNRESNKNKWLDAIFVVDNKTGSSVFSYDHRYRSNSMKRYIKSSLNYSQLEDLCTPIYQEIISKLHEIDLDHRWWHEYNRDNRDGTIRISFGTGVDSPDQGVTYSLKEARHTMLDAISLCSNSLQDSVIKVTQGTTGDRGMIWYVVGVYIRPSTNDYYNIH